MSQLNVQQENDSDLDDDSDDIDDEAMENRLRQQLLDSIKDDIPVNTTQLHNNILNAHIASQNENQHQQESVIDEQATKWVEELNKYCVKMYEKNKDTFGKIPSTIQTMVKNDVKDNNDEDEEMKQLEQQVEEATDIIASSTFSQVFALDSWLDFLDPLSIQKNIDKKLQDIIKVHELASNIKIQLVNKYWADIASAMLDSLNQEDGDGDMDITDAQIEDQTDGINITSEPNKDIFEKLFTLFVPEDGQTFVHGECVRAHEAKEFQLITLPHIQEFCEHVVKTFLYSYLSFCRALHLALCWEIENYQCKDEDQAFISSDNFRNYLEVVCVRSRMITKWFKITRGLFKVDGFPTDFRQIDDQEKVNKTNLFIGAMTELLNAVLQKKVDEFCEQ
eukprot:237106_1